MNNCTKQCKSQRQYIINLFILSVNLNNKQNVGAKSKWSFVSHTNLRISVENLTLSPCRLREKYGFQCKIPKIHWKSTDFGKIHGFWPGKPPKTLKSVKFTKIHGFPEKNLMFPPWILTLNWKLFISLTTLSKNMRIYTEIHRFPCGFHGFYAFQWILLKSADFHVDFTDFVNFGIMRFRPLIK